MNADELSQSEADGSDGPSCMRRRNQSTAAEMVPNEMIEHLLALAALLGSPPCEERGTCEGSRDPQLATALDETDSRGPRQQRVKARWKLSPKPPPLLTRPAVGPPRIPSILPNDVSNSLRWSAHMPNGLAWDRPVCSSLFSCACLVLLAAS